LLKEIELIYGTVALDEIQCLLGEEIAEIAVAAAGSTWLDRTIRELRFERLSRTTTAAIMEMQKIAG
jgi:hypothetical protein